MRLVTLRRPGDDAGDAGSIGALVDGAVVDLGAVAGSMLELLRAGGGGLEAAQAAIERGERPFELDAVELLAPLPRPNSLRDFMLIEEHVRNSFGEVPEAWYEIPVYWKGNPDTVLGPEATVPWPHDTEKLDFELVVGAVIGRRVWHATVQEAEAAIAGYTVVNDWSARDIQFREMQVGLGPGLGKDFATSLGPCLATPDEFDIATARMAARVNGETWAEGGLGSMLHTFPQVIAHLSQEQPLLPGDLLGSGTVGRGCGLELDRWIEPGDVVELECRASASCATPSADGRWASPRNRSSRGARTHDQGDPAGLLRTGRRGQDGGHASHRAQQRRLPGHAPRPHRPLQGGGRPG